MYLILRLSYDIWLKISKMQNIFLLHYNIKQGYLEQGIVLQYVIPIRIP